MSLKRLNKKMLSLLLAVVGLFSFSVPAFANNHGDTGYGFTLYPVHGVGQTSPRQKQDSSYSYMLVQAKTGGGPFWLWVEKAYGQNDINSSVVTKDVGSPAFISQYAFKKHGKVQIVGCIQNQSNHWGGINVSGVWSPDSV